MINIDKETKKFIEWLPLDGCHWRLSPNGDEFNLISDDSDELLSDMSMAIAKAITKAHKIEVLKARIKDCRDWWSVNKTDARFGDRASELETWLKEWEAL